MLQNLMKSIGKVLAAVLFVILLLSFALWGIPNFSREGARAPIATVGSTEISADRFTTALNERRQFMSRQFQTNITPEQARAFGLDQRVMAELVSGAAVSEHVRQMGLRISDAYLADQVRSSPMFQGPDKTFSKQLFETQLAQYGLTTERYFADAREQALREQVTSSLAEGVEPSAVLIDIAHRFREETRTVAYIELDPTKVAKPAAPDDAKLKELYERIKAQFKTTETRSFSVLLLSREDLQSRFKIEDAEVRAHWEKGSTAWDIPERRKFQMLSFKDKAAALAAAKEIAAGKSMFTIALETEALGGRLDHGPATRREIPDGRIAAEVFKQTVGQLSQPVEIRAGSASQFVLIRVTAIEAGRKRPFEEVAKDVRTTLEQARLREVEKQLHEQVEDRRGARRPMAAIAEELKLKLLTVADVDAKGMIAGKPALDHPDARRFIVSAFEGDKAALRDAIPLTGGGEAWVEVTEVKPEGQKPFEDVKANVLAIWTESEHQKAIAEVAETLVGRLKKGEQLAEIAKPLGLKVETTPPFKRIEPPKTLPPAAARQAFALAKGAAGSAEKADEKSKTRVVFVVVDIKPSAAPTKEEAEKLAGQLREQLQNDTLATYIAALRNRYGVTVNQAVYERALGIERATK